MKFFRLPSFTLIAERHEFALGWCSKHCRPRGLNMSTAADNMAMKQQDLGLNLNKRRTRKAVFLDEMNLVVPWTELLSLIAPHAPRAKTGRPPFELETMLRIHFVHGSACPTWPWRKRCSRRRCTGSS